MEKPLDFYNFLSKGIFFSSFTSEKVLPPLRWSQFMMTVLHNPHFNFKVHVESTPDWDSEDLVYGPLSSVNMGLQNLSSFRQVVL